MVNKTFSNAVQVDDEDDDIGDEEANKESNDEDDKNNGIIPWLYLINLYSDTTKEKWTDVWNKPIGEFFTIIQFAKLKAKREEEALNKWKAKH